MSDPASKPTRRDVIKGGIGLAAAAAGAGALAGQARAAPPPASGELTMRTIPATGERVPAVGLGAFQTFDTLPGAPRDHIREVVRRHWEGGGRVFDISPLYGAAETNLGQVIRRMRIQDRLFLANKIWSTGDFAWDDSHAEASLQQSIARLSRHRPIDLMQVHSLTNVDVIVPLLRAWKREGRIRFVGVTHHEPAYFDALAEWVERGVVDFVQVRYSIAQRRAEERVLPAAAERGTAVLVNMALEKARLHHIVGNRPLPPFAVDFGITSWAEYFLKWVLANPAITCALPATSNPAHVTENLRAMRGPLPDAAMRESMVAHMATIPGFDRLETIAWYPGKAYRGLMWRAQQSVLARAG